MKALFLILFLSLPGFLQAQDFAVKNLEKSPRHHEWVDVKNGNRNVHCFVAYPEKATPGRVVVILHENRGLTDWVRSFADRLAAAGYLAIAPDLLSDFDETHAKTTDFENSDAAKKALYTLKKEQVTADLDSVFAYTAGLKAAKGKAALAGFCWGGSQTFRYASGGGALSAAFVFYGGAPKGEKSLQKIQVPVYGFYAENDARINAGIPATETRMKAGGKLYKYEIYKKAGHAFMRRGETEGKKSGNGKAQKAALKRLLKLLKKLD